MKRVHARIFGLVQGVFFRQYTMNKAQELGINGFVRNLADGSVEVVAEASEEKLKKLVEFLNIGSPASKVERVKVKWLEAKNEFSGFHVEH